MSDTLATIHGKITKLEGLLAQTDDETVQQAFENQIAHLKGQRQQVATTLVQGGVREGMRHWQDWFQGGAAVLTVGALPDRPAAARAAPVAAQRAPARGRR
jgi:hypothetical protein